MHAGSGNHGCEAIANTVCKMLPKPAIIVTNSAAEDERYSLKGLCTLIEEKKIRENFFIHVYYYLKERYLNLMKYLTQVRFPSKDYRSKPSLHNYRSLMCELRTNLHQ